MLKFVRCASSLPNFLDIFLKLNLVVFFMSCADFASTIDTRSYRWCWYESDPYWLRADI